MKNADILKTLIFNENTPFIELLIIAEMDSEKEFEKLKRRIPETIQELHGNRVTARYSDYALLERNITFSGEDDEEYTYTLTLEIGMTEIDSKSDYEDLTFSEYLQQLEFKVVCMDADDMAGEKDESSFPLTVQGLLEAVTQFNAMKLELTQ